MTGLLDQCLVIKRVGLYGPNAVSVGDYLGKR